GYVFKTTNGGTSWNSLFVTTGLGYIDALALDPSAPGTLYLVSFNDIYKTTDGGVTWQLITSSAQNFGTLRVDPVVPSTLYAGRYSGEGAYKSVDGGVTWSQINTGLANLVVHSFAFTPSATTIYAGTAGGVYRSSNGGASWSLGVAGMNAVSINKLAADPLTGSTLYAVVDGGFTRSTDGGSTWSPVSNVLSDSFVYDLVIDPANPTTLYAAGNRDLSKSTDGGSTWTNANSAILYIRHLAIDPRTPTTLYAGTSFAGVYKSTDGAASWNPINAGLTITNITELAVDPVTPNIVYAAGYSYYDYAAQQYVNGSLYKSADGGASWNRLSAGLPSSNISISDIQIDPRTPTRLYALVNVTLYTSANAGASWAPMSNAPPGLSNLTIDPTTPTTLYGAATSNAVYRSTDSGGSWNQIGSPLSGYITALLVNPVNPATVYAGTNRGVYSFQQQAVRLTVSVPEFASARAPFEVLAYVINPDGSLATSFNAPVTLAIQPGSGATGAALSGTTTVNASGGVARFSVAIDRPASGYRLIVTAGGLSGAISVPFDVDDPEVEPNDTIAAADRNNQLTFDSSGRTNRTGWLSTSDDADWYRFDTALTGVTVTVDLTNLPADYDLALVSDPRPTLTTAISDGISLTNVSDASQTDASGRLISLSLSESLSRIAAIGHLPGAAQYVLNQSANYAAENEAIVAKLPRSGTYYLLVFSTSGASDSLRPYRLRVSLQGGTLLPTPPTPAPVASLNLESRSDVQTIFLYNSARMRARYPAQENSIAELIARLGGSSTLLAASHGASIDLSG
ncbi:MAG TPA: hypothetical protein VFX76_22615, partial [Roseiflexaceae bacterium]|nr:hypothetical protein [Roseiflexaceae bacterium]